MKLSPAFLLCTTSVFVSGQTSFSSNSRFTSQYSYPSASATTASYDYGDYASYAAPLNSAAASSSGDYASYAAAVNSASTSSSFASVPAPVPAQAAPAEATTTSYSRSSWSEQPIVEQTSWSQSTPVQTTVLPAQIPAAIVFAQQAAPASELALGPVVETFSNIIEDDWISASTGDQDDFFSYDEANPAKLRKFNFEISAANLARINQNPTDEEWVPCTITTDYHTEQAEVYDSAGCRYKGSVGSLRLCMNENTKKFDPDICRKLSFKVDTNKFLPDEADGSSPKRDIYGMKTLLFNGAPNDWSLMSERVSYSMMNELGMTAPRSIHSRLYLNGAHAGVYVMPEEVDQRFTRDRFKKDNNKGRGALYKEAWLNDVNLDFKKKQKDGAEDESAFMRSLVGLIEQAPTSQAEMILSQYFDIDNFVNAIAFNEIVLMTDDWRMRHNFLWYVRDDDEGKKLVYIPWDYDRVNDAAAYSRGATGIQGPWYQVLPPHSFKCTKRIQSIQEKALAICMGDTQAYCEKMEEIYSELPDDINIPVQCDQMTHLMAAALKERISQRVLEMTETFTVTRVQELIESFSNHIRYALKKDPDGPVESYWNKEKSELIDWFRQRRNEAIERANEGFKAYEPSVGSNYTPGQFGGKFTPINNNKVSSGSSSSSSPMMTTASSSRSTSQSSWNTKQGSSWNQPASSFRQQSSSPRSSSFNQMSSRVG